MIIDSHAHITFKEYAKDLQDVIKRSFEVGVQIINASNSLETSRQAVELAEKYDNMWAVVGCHPDDLEENLSARGGSAHGGDIEKYRQLAQSSKKVVGIGEVGLDYYRLAENGKDTKAYQKEIFMQFIDLAQELDLPLVLHCRGAKDDPYCAYDEILDFLKSKTQNPKSESRGVIHCFGGNLEQANKFLDLGFYIGITGIVTFKNAKELQAIVKEVPLDKILIETDAPFLAPEPYRGQRNEPSYVKYVCQKIADLKGLSFEEVESATYKNTCRLFNLK